MSVVFLEPRNLKKTKTKNKKPFFSIILVQKIQAQTFFVPGWIF